MVESELVKLEVVSAGAPGVIKPVNSTDYRMNMKPSYLYELKRDTVTRSIQTIGTRINDLGFRIARSLANTAAAGGANEPAQGRK